jgi:hypothetical protein
VPPVRTAAALAVVLASLGMGATAARADVPRARIAVGSGLRLNFGELGEDFAWGWQILDVQAALQPISFLRGGLRTGPAWWTTIGRFSATGSDTLDAEISLMHMGLGWRVAGALPIYGYPVSAHAMVGYEFVRSSRPLPPEMEGTHFGPAAQLGLEYGSGSSFWGLQVTWDPIGTRTEGVYVLAFVGLGSP